MLSRQKSSFSEPFYRRIRQHLFRVITRMTLFLVISGVLAGTNLFYFFRGINNTTHAGIGAAVFGAIFLFICWATYQSIRSLLKVRVIPYFERPLGQMDTWMSGENYLRHSKKLDEIAILLGVRPLSQFASGDDLVRGEVLCWFSPDEALQTLERILQTDVTTSLPTAVVLDLKRFRDSLRLACSKSIKFCFLIREGSCASGLEMERRKGSFF
jgi:hypothetical protein